MSQTHPMTRLEVVDIETLEVKKAVYMTTQDPKQIQAMSDSLLRNLNTFQFFVHSAPSWAPSAVDVQDRQVAASPWISITDRLPAPETDVLVVLRGKVHVGAIFIEIESYEEGGREIHYWDDPNFDGQDWAWDDVTHWMPLPAAPAAQKAV